jgi:hypothetical protein
MKIFCLLGLILVFSVEMDISFANLNFRLVSDFMSDYPTTTFPFSSVKSHFHLEILRINDSAKSSHFILLCQRSKVALFHPI